AAVTLDDVSVRVPRRAAPVLDRVDLHVRRGEQVLLLGASGSGKSTVLQCITGVVPHSVTARLTGEVRVCGTRTTDARVVDLSRHVGVLAQDPSSAVCLPDVEQEVVLPLENHAADPATMGARIDAVLAQVGAAHLRTRRTGELSGGESHRAGAARGRAGTGSRGRARGRRGAPRAPGGAAWAARRPGGRGGRARGRAGGGPARPRWARAPPRADGKFSLTGVASREDIG